MSREKREDRGQRAERHRERRKEREERGQRKKEKRLGMKSTYIKLSRAAAAAAAVTQYGYIYRDKKGQLAEPPDGKKRKCSYIPVSKNKKKDKMANYYHTSNIY